MHLSVRGWDKTDMEQRRRIVLAAYCPIAVQAGRGRLWWGNRDVGCWWSMGKFSLWTFGEACLTSGERNF